ncbi:hypothetical protein [Psychroserpens burtonensis]|uniref:hypothetical protein n=1 Tax=Psychroserpens burtonensis TaxID=49278 RepID=UPI00042108CC|nr:hypothetical protein [Psychroserpens burtonensis]
MENQNLDALNLTNTVFNVLIESVVNHFKLKHNILIKYKDSQLYGFGNYNTEQPSLKGDFELIIKSYVNGKYLYNKQREAASGKPIIKISGDYKNLFFKYLGFQNITDFIKSDLFTSKQRIKQLELITKGDKINEHHYVCYYYGEDSKMNKGQVIIHNNWKTIEMIYVYVNEKEEKNTYTFYGNITQSEDFAHINTKYYVGNKKSEGAKFIFFIGKSSPNERQYLIGTYCGFDKYDRAISGKMILKKYNSKAEIEDEANDKSFDPILCQELNKNRTVVESNIRKNPLLFSKKSPFAQVLTRTSGDYVFKFEIEQTRHELKLKIEKYHFNIISINDSIIIEDDRVTVLNKGQIINFDFSVSGMFHLQKISIYINAIYFVENDNKVTGIFNGVDINNKIVSGNLSIVAIN